MPARRGPYAKGLAKREEILARALEVVAREGYRGASVKEIADAVGLSQAGLLHYFDSKEELFTEILRKRDELDGAVYGGDGPPQTRREFVRLIRHNAEVPGLVALFSRLAVDAADPAHPAHAFFLERATTMHAMISGADAEQLPAGMDPETFGRILQAVADGLQLQWMLDPSIDMAGTVDALLSALGLPAPDEAADV